MPRKQIDYTRTQIYRIVCNDLKMNELYIGSTIDFRNRQSTHKKSCNNENRRDYNYKIYQIIRLNGGWENWKMILIESYPCADGLEARRRERYWYEELNPTMNTFLPYITEEEKRENQKEYREINKVKLAAKRKEKENSQSNKDKAAEYREKNKGKAAEYREINKVKLAAKRTEKVNCPICDKQLCRKSLSQHCKVCHPIMKGSSSP